MPLNHPAAKAYHLCDAAKPVPTADPTGTADIRRRFRGQTDIRWRRFSQMLRAAVMQQDVLGLKSGSTVSAMSIMSASSTPDARIRIFQSWVDATLTRVVLETDTAYLDGMAATAYRRAVARAMRLSFSQAQPKLAGEAIASLQQLTLVEMQGVCEAVSQQLVRAGTDAIISKRTPQQAWQALSPIVEKIGVNRSRAVVEVLTIKAHGAGTLDQFEAAGIKKVAPVPETIKVTKPTKDGFVVDAPKKVAPAPARRGQSASTKGRIAREEAAVERALRNQEVEVLTAGDDLVCPECEDIAADGPYTIDEARSLIPAHPNCRCSFVPEGSTLFGSVIEGIL
jgi:predicted Fe-Mo cluster-binding NifX family protein